MPSAKYDCSGSPLMLSNGRTAIEVLPAAVVGTAPERDGSAGEAARSRAARRPPPDDQRHGDERATAAPTREPARPLPMSGGDGATIARRAVRRGAGHRIGAHRVADVLDVLQAAIDEGRRDATLHRAAHRLRDHDAARLGERLQAGGDVDAVAVDAVGSSVSMTSPRWTPMRKRSRRRRSPGRRRHRARAAPPGRRRPRRPPSRTRPGPSRPRCR